MLGINYSYSKRLQQLVGPSRKRSLTKTGSSKDHHPAPNYVARLFRLASGQKSKVQNPKMVSPNLEFSGHVSPSIPHPFLFNSNYKPSFSMDVVLIAVTALIILLNITDILYFK